MNKPTVTVSINTFNRPDDLRACLSSLQNQTYKDFDIIVANGGENALIEQLAKGFSLNIRVFEQKKRGLVEARNICWRESRSDLVCIIDDDLVVSANWLEEIVKTFQSDDKIGGVTGPTLVNPGRQDSRDAFSVIEKFEKGGFFWRIIGKFYLDFVMEGKIREIGKILKCGTFSMGSNFSDSLKGLELFDVDYLEACCMCYRRKFVEQTGGFDELYKGTSEWSEPDLSFKVKNLGVRLVFNPKAVTEHRISQAGVFKARTYAYERSINFINFYFRHIKPNTWAKFSRFYSYLCFTNAYWAYKGLTSKNLNWLTGITGTFVALFNNVLLRKPCKS